MQTASVVKQMKQIPEHAFLEDGTAGLPSNVCLLYEEQARQNFARTIHDDLGQLLAVIKIKLSLLDQKIDQHESRVMVREIDQLIDQVNQSLIQAIKQIYPLPLHTTVLMEGLEYLAAEFAKKHGIAVHINDDGMAKPLDETTRLVLFSAVYELLINATRHAQTSAIEIDCLLEGSSLTIAVTDFGSGFKPCDKPGAHGGLHKIRKYIEHLGGKMCIDSRPDDRTTVALSAPLNFMDIKLATNNS
ncbi:histidine kinase [uncultured Azonexus sp.]|uniref:sensor histidine kinase n=1 Tax=uncultured Azonexus sp. TaxID=520307 RepID=UPI002620A9C8|nr:histidine kinase [uncultured Azonexus sp.]